MRPLTISVLAITVAASLTSFTATRADTAATCDSFVNSIGVNVKLNYFDTPYVDYAKTKAVLLKAGIRHIRTGITTNPLVIQRTNDLAAAGIMSTVIVFNDAKGDITPASVREQLTAILPSLEAIEGPNEPDAGFAFGGKQFPASVILFQNMLAAIAKEPQFAKIPLLAPSISYPPKSAQVPNIAADLGNIHSYHGGRNPGTTEKNLDLTHFYLENAAIETPGKPIICTETGNPNTAVDDPSLWMPRTPESVQAKYLLRTYLDYFRQGISRTFVHELVDEHPLPNLSEQNFGLLRNDWSPKPVYTSLCNTIAIMQDAGPTFKPASLDYTLQGDVANVRHLLLQKRDGTFYLVLWQEVSGYDTATKQPIGVPDAQVTLTIPSSFTAVTSYLPMQWATPCKEYANKGPIPLRILDEPVILEIASGGVDLIVESASVEHAAVSGQPVKFTATVKNTGNRPTPPERMVSVTFFDKTHDHKMLTYSSTWSKSIAPGATATMVTDGTWTPPAAGSYEIEAQVDDLNRVAETNESNNTTTFTVTVK
ncbi:MAG TPA: CARDB domain-containing protein [Capsulimonadaceae bacterium]|jgi:hypothetical protein